MKITYKFTDGIEVKNIKVSDTDIIEITDKTLETCLGIMIANFLGKEIVSVTHEE